MLDERYPNLTQYMTRLEARPAFQAAVERWSIGRAAIAALRSHDHGLKHARGRS
jgi:glutathione S-transferase